MAAYAIARSVFVNLLNIRLEFTDSLVLVAAALFLNRRQVDGLRDIVRVVWVQFGVDGRPKSQKPWVVLVLVQNLSQKVVKRHDPASQNGESQPP